MYDQKYVLLVTELQSLINAHKSLKDTVETSDADLRWRLAELFKTVNQKDEQKYIDLAGMQGFLTTTEEKLELEKASRPQSPDPKSNITDQLDFDKKEPDQAWAKSLYRRAVKRCHPDTIRINDKEYKEELVAIYKDITEAYSNSMLDELMVKTYKVFVKPKEVITEQIQILETSSRDYKNKILGMQQSKGYTWSTLTEEEKELFLVNFMKQQGVRFVDKSKIKEVLSRKPRSRKVGERPKNNLRERVKGKK
jgi:hypothetical protein